VQVYRTGASQLHKVSCAGLLILLAVGLVQPALADDDAAKRAALLAGYPGLFGFQGNDVVFTDGTRIVWDDGKVRSAAELIETPDVEDMFHYVYPLAASGASIPPTDFDPGRIRNEAFFKAVYGGSARAVEAQTVAVPWAGGTVRVTRLFDIDSRISTIGAAMTGELAPYARKPGGGFNWRAIDGTTQLSVHSFGAAFDINVDYSNYWRWAAKGDGSIVYENRIPLPIVALFEDQGFIWGGRWYHYDTMHFEYRPELIAYAKAHTR